jgi:predicted Zn-dependent peptidase
MADLIQNPAFPSAELDRLKRDRIRQLSIQQSQPGSIALARFRAEMYGDHPYGRIFPDEAMVQGYTLDDIRAFYDANLGAARAHVYVAGRFDRQAMERAIRDAFGGWERGADPLMAAPEPHSERTVHIVDMPGAAQSNVYIGLPVIDPSHPDYVALQVTNALLGGSFGSRITSNIREDKGYTYSPFSQVSSRYRDAYWAQVAAITTEVTGPAIGEIFNEIDRLPNEPPSPEELEGIQNYLAGTFVLQNSSRGGIIGQLSFLDLHGLDASYLTGYVDNVYAVTPEDVQQMTRQYLRAEDMLIVIAGDKEQIEQQVAPFDRPAN